MKIEVLALALNIVILSRYVWQWHEPGKIIYWLGAVLITLGLLKMNG